MLDNSWFKKEKPFLGLVGMAGGAAPLGSGVPAGRDPQDPPGGHDASGRIIRDYATPTANYRAHIFTSPSPFVISSLSPTYPAHVEYLVVAGGAGGGGPGAHTGGSGGGAIGGAFCSLIIVNCSGS